MAIRVKGLSDQENAQFLDFFKETLGDAKATTYYLSKPKFRLPDELVNTQVFVMRTETIVNKLLPLFKEKVLKIEKASSQELDEYRNLSKNAKGVIQYKLPVLLEEIMTQVLLLQSFMVNEFALK